MENLEHRLRKTKLRRFGHIKCRDENSILRSVMDLEVIGRRLVGWLRKTWSKLVEENIRKLDIKENITKDRKQWRQFM